MSSIRPTKQQPIVPSSSRIAYETPWIKVQEDLTLRLGGGEGVYSFVDTPDSVIVCAINDKNEVYIIWGYSYPTDSWSWQIPGGGGDNEPPIVAGARELQEETGITASSYEDVGNLIVCCGLLKERMSIIVATDLEIGEKLDADDTELIGEGKFVSFDTALEMIDSGEICDSQSVSAIYLAQRWTEKHSGC